MKIHQDAWFIGRCSDVSFPEKEDEIQDNRKIFLKFHQPNFISISPRLIILIKILFSFSDIYTVSFKGQLISKCPCGVFKFPKSFLMISALASRN